MRGKHTRGEAFRQVCAAGTLAAAVLMLLAGGTDAQAQSRPWDLSIRAFVNHDDNVELTPEAIQADDPEESLGAGASFAGSYRVYRGSGLRVRVGATGFHLRRLDRGVDEFDVTALTPYFAASYATRLWGLPATASGLYALRRDWVGGDGFSRAHAFSLGLQVRPLPGLSLGPAVGVAIKDFDDDGADPDVTSRDAVRPSLGVSLSYRFPDVSEIAVGYGYTASEADGENFEYRSHALFVRYERPILTPLAPLTLVLDADYAAVDYIDFVRTPRREQDNYRLRALLYVALGPRLTADLSYTHSRNQSNRDAFETRRSIVAIGLTYRF